MIENLIPVTDLPEGSPITELKFQAKVLIEECRAHISTSNHKEALEALKTLIDHVKLLCSYMPNLDIKDNQKLAPLIENIGLLSSTAKTIKNELDASVKPNEDLTKAQKALQNLEIIQSRESKISRHFDSVEKRLKEVEKEHQEKLGAIQNLFDTNRTEILKKQKDIDALFGIASGNALAGGYAKRAEKEEITENILRYASLTIMVAMICLFGWALHDTTDNDFKWNVLLFKAVVSIMLSVPATYLARESTKHRHEHQYYLSKALDISAIDPYIANLPDQEKHKLKSKIALRLFAARRETPQETNDLPLNAHEIILKLIDKNEIKIEPKTEKNE